MTPQTLPDRLLAEAENWRIVAPDRAALLREAAAALSGGEAVAMVSRGRTRGHLCWLGNNEAKWPHGTFLYTAPQPGDGWRLLPEEPTEEMLDALRTQEAYCENCKGYSFDARNGYAAMIAAAPSAKGVAP